MTLTKQDLNAIENLLDNKLEQKLDEKLDEKLEPIKKDLADVKKIVNREFIKVHKRLDRLEDISLAVVEDLNDHETRIKRLEKHTKLNPSN